MAVQLAHISDVAALGPLTAALVAIVVGVVAGLHLMHLHVKHQGLPAPQVRRVIAVGVALAVGAVVLPAPSLAQSSSEPVGLPDLVSDPPFIWRTRNIRTPQGDVIRVMTFDGYIHNIGTGKLEISGNPQVEGGMQQRVFDGTEWTEVGSPPNIKFETDDGHNHFHLMRAVDYALWSEDRSEQVTDASKVGFCLVDTEQMEEGHDSNYLIDDFNYCGVDDPDTTELTMGITPGWRDTYDANVTMQWVDISNTLPGWYWTSAVTDPNNEIVESNEDNNDIVFSQNKFAVDGYVARQLGPQTSAEPITLRANVYGVVGERAFVISTPPSNGRLDVPTGVDLLDLREVRYTPEPGFTGTDSFTYYAHDVTTPFPYDPHMVEVVVTASAADQGAVDALDDELAIDDPGAQQASLFEPVTLTITADGDAGSTRWHANGLPAGLSIDTDSGVITGVPTFAGDHDSVIYAYTSTGVGERTISWSVADAPAPNLTPINGFSTSGAENLTLPIGVATEGATYEGVGLPAGGFVVSNQPLIGGTPQESGVFTVQVNEIIDDEIVDTIQFEWSVRPSTRPAFPL